MFNFLSSLANLGLYFTLWSVLAFWLYRRKHKLFSWHLGFGVVVFLICSTNYIPKRLVASIEKAYTPVVLEDLDRTETYYIHVLGSGASDDPRLPASLNLSRVSLTRLAEGIRIYNHLDQAILVTSAASKKGLRNQAELSKEAAIALGVSASDIKTLPTPTTTLEEAKAFKQKFGTDKTIVLVTCAMHMPRAVTIFRDQGLTVIPAPSGYLFRDDAGGNNGFTLPSIKSLELMNAYQVTVLKDWYYALRGE